MVGRAQCSCRDCLKSCDTADGGWTLCRVCLDARCTPYPREGEPRPVGLKFIQSEYDCRRQDQEG